MTTEHPMRRMNNRPARHDEDSVTAATQPRRTPNSRKRRTHIHPTVGSPQRRGIRKRRRQVTEMQKDRNRSPSRSQLPKISRSRRTGDIVIRSLLMPTPGSVRDDL